MQTKAGVFVLILAAAALILAGCGGGGGDATGFPDNGTGGDVNTTGNVRVLLTDAPAVDLAEVWVSILRVELVPADEGPIIELDSDELPGQFELLGLADNPLELGVIELPAGDYEQVRLVLAEDGHYVVDADGVEHQIRVPSGTQSGVKVNFPDGVYRVTEGDQTLLLDFLAGPSVHQAGQSGQWIMRPVIHGSATADDEPEFGAIEGAVAYENGTIPQAMDGNPPAVFVDGDEAENIGEIDTATGEFAIPSLLAGEYELEVGWLDAEGEMEGELLIVTDAGAVDEIEVVVEPNATLNVDLVVREEVEEEEEPEEGDDDELGFGAVEGTVAYEDGTIPQAMDGNPPAVFAGGDEAEESGLIDTATGEFAIPSLPAGDYELEVGWLDAEAEMEGELLIVTDSGAVDEIEVVVEPDATLNVDLVVREEVEEEEEPEA